MLQMVARGIEAPKRTLADDRVNLMGGSRSSVSFRGDIAFLSNAIQWIALGNMHAEGAALRLGSTNVGHAWTASIIHSSMMVGRSYRSHNVAGEHVQHPFPFVGAKDRS